MGKDFDSDIVETIEKLKACEDVQKALQLVKQQLPEIIEIQKELTLIEAPTFHEENKAKISQSMDLTSSQKEYFQDILNKYQNDKKEPICTLSSKAKTYLR